MRILMRTLIFGLILLNVATLHAYDVDAGSSDVDLLKHAEIFLDTAGTLSKEEALNQTFVKNDKEVLGFGFDDRLNVWVRFTLKNVTGSPLEKTIEYANTYVEDLYFYDGDTVRTGGRFHVEGNPKTLTPSFQITLQPYEERTFYFEAHSHTPSLLIKLRLWNNDRFLEHDYAYKMIEIAFFAAMATLFIYNFMLWVFTRQRAYLFYIFYLLCVMFFQANLLRIPQLYLFSPEVAVIVEKASSIHISLLMLSIVFFTREFLETKQFKRLDAVFRFYLYTTPVVALLGYDNFAYNLNMVAYFIPLGIFTVFTGFYALYKGVRQARFYVIGWSVVIFSLIILNLKTLGLIDVGRYFFYINEVAFLLEALLFSIALAHKIKILSEEKERSKNALIEFQQKEQERLSELVDAKTKELTAALEEKSLLYKELNHRVKNNIQMILSLIHLQIIKSDNEATKAALGITRDRIYSIANLYKTLYLQEENFQPDTLAYFQSIVGNIQTIASKEVEIVYDVQGRLTLDQLLHCGLIINELVTNAYKYAFKENGGRITITLTEEDGRFTLTVRDNGVGFTQEAEESLGLTIVRTLAEKQLLGEVHIVSTPGAAVTVSWHKEEES